MTLVGGMCETNTGVDQEPRDILTFRLFVLRAPLLVAVAGICQEQDAC